MSPRVTGPNAPKPSASPRPTPAAVRSLGSAGSDGDRKAAPGVAPLLGLVAFLALAAGAHAAAVGLAQARRVERDAGAAAEAARALQAEAAAVAAAGRLQSLVGLQDLQRGLERSTADLARSVAALEGAGGVPVR